MKLLITLLLSIIFYAMQAQPSDPTTGNPAAISHAPGSPNNGNKPGTTNNVYFTSVDNIRYAYTFEVKQVLFIMGVSAQDTIAWKKPNGVWVVKDAQRLADLFIKVVIK